MNVENVDVPSPSAATQSLREAANRESLGRILAAEPVLIDVAPAGEVLPGFHEKLILTSGAPLAWSDYVGGQRRAILGAVVFEGLAANLEEAERLIENGDIELGACHDHAAVGSVAGVYSASMPVLVVENRTRGNLGFCTIYEGSQRERLTYGVWNSSVESNLRFIRERIGPGLGSALRKLGGIELAPIMRRALRMGDELHSRNTAATSLLGRAVAPTLARVAAEVPAADDALNYICGNDLFFLHVGMAAGKAIADAAWDVPRSGIVTAMASNGSEFAIRVSGLGSEWFRAPNPPFHGNYFEGFSVTDQAYMGGESLIMETVGFGGLASAAAFALRDYSGGTPEWMIENNLKMYQITAGEGTQYRIPYLGRGCPTGIDIFKVVEEGVPPTMHAGAAHRDGGHIGAGYLEAPLSCFEQAVKRYRAVYE